MEPIEFYGSLQSPYCYFALDRLESLRRDLGAEIAMRTVRPGVIRIPDAYAGRSQTEIAYLERDVHRTAEFLRLPYGSAEPSPVNWVDGADWIAESDQPRLYRIHNMLYRAHQSGEEYRLYSTLMRLIWSGRTRDWDNKQHLNACLAKCDLPGDLIDQPDELLPDAAAYFTTNEQAMYACGHWGVPLFSWRGEPFYGQDRLDQLRWRIESS